MIKCGKCNSLVEEEYNFCPICGNKLENEKLPLKNLSLDNNILHISKVICSVCGEDILLSNRFCDKCGAKLDGTEKSISEGKETKINGNQVIAEENKKENAAFSKKKNKVKISVTNQTKNKVGIKNLTVFQLSSIILSLFAVGIIILLSSGLLDSNKQNMVETGNNNLQSNSKINLGDIRAIEELENVVKNDTLNLKNVLELAHRLNDAGFYERAIDYYKIYLRREPKNADVQIDLGVCYFELKKYDNAKTEMLKGLKINPNHQIGLFNLGVVSLSQGILDSAKYWWKKSILIDETTEIAKKAKQFIESN